MYLPFSLVWSSFQETIISKLHIVRPQSYCDLQIDEQQSLYNVTIFIISNFTKCINSQEQEI